MKLSKFRSIIREEVFKMVNEDLNNTAGVQKEILQILKTLHAFSDKIKFRVQNVNGTDNIVYDDEQMLTQGIISKLKDRKFWNTGFDATIGKFPGNRINISFDKSVQDKLNIRNFDKTDWNLHAN